MLTKKHIKTRNVCKVTFEVPKSEVPDVTSVKAMAVAGDFNEWDASATPMAYSKKKKAYRVIVELEPGQEYQYRYLLNREHWFNDWQADGYVPGPLGEDNSVLKTPSE